MTVDGVYACLVIPLQLQSEANAREHHMAKHRRKKFQQGFVWPHLVIAGAHLAGNPVAMAFCRFGQHMDPDNNGGSFKHVQDGICRHLGVNDGQIPITYDQIDNGLAGFSVMIRMEAHHDEAGGSGGRLAGSVRHHAGVVSQAALDRRAGAGDGAGEGRALPARSGAASHHWLGKGGGE